MSNKPVTIESIRTGARYRISGQSWYAMGIMPMPLRIDHLNYPDNGPEERAGFRIVGKRFPVTNEQPTLFDK